MRLAQLKLIPSSPEYADIAYLWRLQEHNLRHNPLLKLSLSEVRDLLEKEGHDLKKLHDYKTHRWMASIDGSIVGMVNLKNINSMMNTAEIGYGIDEKYHGKGFGTKMVKLFIDKVFQETELRKLFAYVHDKNIPSCRILEKVGFKKEGLLREHYVINGKPENEIFFGLLRSDLYNQ